MDEGTGDGFRLRGSKTESSWSISHSESGDGKKFLRLPLVSVIVVNFNYGRYLRAALAKNTIRSRRFLAMANQGVPGFVLRAVEGDFRPGENFGERLPPPA